MSDLPAETASVLAPERLAPPAVEPAIPALAQKSERLASLDVFRGMTMAGMILVNNAGRGGEDYVYGPLRHADWNGWTPTDLVFPSFVFIVGVALTFSFDKRIASGFSRLRLFEQVCRRTMILIFLGLILTGFTRWRLIGPYVLGIVGLAFLFIDEPPLGWPAALGARIRKVFAWLVLAGALFYFVVDFDHFQTSKPILRVPGVLQRIALCYFFASIIVMYSGVRGRAIWTAVFLLGYWAIVAYVTPPSINADLAASRPLGVLHDWIDVKLLGAHLYGERPEPEGLLSTIPAIATTLLGVLAGNWLKAPREKSDKVIGLFLAANIALFFGLWMNNAFPINKKIWTSSYVLFAGGIALHVLAICYWLVDVKSYQRWAKPFMVFGTNAIAVYVASGIFGRLLSLWKLPSADGHTVTPGTGFGEMLKTWAYQTLHPTWAPWTDAGGAIAVRTWLYQSFFTSWASPKFASLLWALAYVLLWLLLMTPLYRRRIFVKV